MINNAKLKRIIEYNKLFIYYLIIYMEFLEYIFRA